LWSRGDFFNGLDIEAFHRVYRLPAPMEPLIFWDPEGYGDWDDFAFACGGRYYFYDECRETVQRYYGTYASPTAFLRAQIESFVVAPRESARMLELYELQMRCEPSSLDREDWLYRINQEMATEFRNPPPNELYTEIFPQEETYE
jgi:hypothetical protein